jgi:hypothetical protein
MPPPRRVLFAAVSLHSSTLVWPMANMCCEQRGRWDRLLHKVGETLNTTGIKCVAPFFLSQRASLRHSFGTHSLLLCGGVDWQMHLAATSSARYRHHQRAAPLRMLPVDAEFLAASNLVPFLLFCLSQGNVYVRNNAISQFVNAENGVRCALSCHFFQMAREIVTWSLASLSCAVLSF